MLDGQLGVQSLGTSSREWWENQQGASGLEYFKFLSFSTEFCYTAQADLTSTMQLKMTELLTLLPPPPKCCDYMCVPPEQVKGHCAALG